MPTPISDIQNTLMKMAQKRAMVGATILAAAASDFFSQDIEDMDEGVRGNDTQPTNTDVDREKRINSLIENLRKVGVSEKMIRTKYGAGDKASFYELTDKQCKELNQIGSDIHAKKTTVKEQFPFVNFASNQDK
jgi:hypothetical protein